MTVYRSVAGPIGRLANADEGRQLGFSGAEWGRLAGLYGFIALLHVLGWGLFLYYASRHPTLVGLGFVAYMLGLRHAFDVDHIAAVDDTVRYMLQKGKRPLVVGFFFSLGHSTVVLALAVGIVVSAAAIKTHLPGLQHASSTSWCCSTSSRYGGRPVPENTATPTSTHCSRSVASSIASLVDGCRRSSTTSGRSFPSGCCSAWGLTRQPRSACSQ